MTIMIGKLIWKNRNMGVLLNLKGIKIPFEIDKMDSIKIHLYAGMMVIFDAIPYDGVLNWQMEAVNIRFLEEEQREDILLECFLDADPLQVEDAISHISSFSIAQKISALFSQNCLYKNNDNIQQIINIDNEIKDHSHIFYFRSCTSLCVQRPNYLVQWSPKLTQSLMDHNDLELAAKWLPEKPIHKKALLAQMLSARVAEKVAQSFYQEFQKKVSDISITQLTGESEEWHKYDILLNDKIPIDVKNARNPVKNKIRYVDYCVPAFKYDRQGKEVIIVGVFSPYLQLNQILGTESINNNVNDIIFLGETTQTIIQALETDFTSQKLQIGICKYRRYGNKFGTILPPWIFDYSNEYYREQNTNREELKKFECDRYSIGRRWPHDFNPVPALIACGLSIPDEWNCVDNDQREFVKKLYQHTHGRVVLPVLYLTLLADFLEKVSSSKVSISFSPKKYYSLFYNTDIYINPLGIRDPLNIIRDLISALVLLWNNRSSIPWSSITSYHFNGMGLLTGKTNNGQSLTILAYCGGAIEGKGTCGHSPLVVGQNKTCPHGKLICNECGYCCEKCHPHKKRPVGEEWDDQGMQENNRIDEEIHFLEPNSFIADRSI